MEPLKLTLSPLSFGIALCSCNGAKYLSQQLDSIMIQAVAPHEMVICDDRSDDGTWDVLQKWVVDVAEPKGIAITLIRNQERLGVTRNFERACSLLNTDLIFLCDQDDVWPNDKIERMLVEFRNSEVMLVHSDAYLVDASLGDLGVSLFEALRISRRERQLIKEGRFFEIYCRRNLVTGAAAAFRRSLLSVARPFPAEWVHDEWLAAMAAVCGRVVMLPEPLLLYRQHGGNVIGMPKNLRENISHARRRLRELPRCEFFKARIRRLSLLFERIKSMDGDYSWQQDYIRGALEHFESRSQMAANPVRRFRRVLIEWKSGRYMRYSGGRGGVLRDLLYL